MAKWLRKAAQWLLVVCTLGAAWVVSVWKAHRQGQEEGRLDAEYEAHTKRIEDLKGNEEHRAELLRDLKVKEDK